MLKIVIVDDEPLVRMGIRSCVPWQENGFLFAGEAADGAEALKLIQEVGADIVFTDIKMPNMDGLALIKALKQSMPHVRVIVLSCINEMETVKQAIQLGADDYILKLSLKPSKMVELLQALKAKIEAEEAIRLQQENYNTVISDHLYAIQSNLLQRYLNGGSVQKAREALELIEPGYFPSLFYPILARIDQNDNYDALLQRHPNLPAAINRLAYEQALHFAYLSGTEILFWAQSTRYHWETLRQIVLPQFNRGLSSTADLTFSFALTARPFTLEELPQAVEMLRNQLQRSFYLGAGCIVGPQEEPLFSYQTCIWPANSAAIIRQALDSGDFSALRKMVCQDLDSFQQTAPFPPTQLKLAAISFMNDLLRQTGFYSETSSISQQPGSLYQSQTVMKMQTIQELRRCILRVLHNVELMLAESGAGSRREITLAKKYVYEHLAEDITTHQVAQYVNISRSYFSSLFKREEGENFVDFVNRTKMEYARDLMVNHNYKVYEVSAMVGIPSETYFSKLFKKHIGLSPSKFLHQGK